MQIPAHHTAPSDTGFAARPLFHAFADRAADDGCDAVAIGRLVDARIRQLRQLCGARGLLD